MPAVRVERSERLVPSMLREGEASKESATAAPLELPALAVDRGGSDFTLRTLRAAHADDVRAARIEGAGHYIAMDAPDKLATALLAFVTALRSDDQASALPAKAGRDSRHH